MTARICSRIGTKWTLPRYKRDWRSICALLPAYLDDGTNGTVIHYVDDTAEAVAYRLCWVLDDLLGYLHTSRDVLTKQSRVYLGKSARRVPLIATAELALVPVKGRQALMRNDGITGYAVLEHVQDVIPRGAENRLYFTGGSYITVYDTTRTLWENLNLTKELKQELEERQWQSTPLHSVGA